MTDDPPDKDPYTTSVWDTHKRSTEWVSKMVSAIECNVPKDKGYVIFLHNHSKGEGCTVGCTIKTPPKDEGVEII